MRSERRDASVPTGQPVSVVAVTESPTDDKSRFQTSSSCHESVSACGIRRCGTHGRGHAVRDQRQTRVMKLATCDLGELPLNRSAARTPPKWLPM